jgi:hypothetical protein
LKKVPSVRTGTGTAHALKKTETFLQLVWRLDVWLCHGLAQHVALHEELDVLDEGSNVLPRAAANQASTQESQNMKEDGKRNKHKTEWKRQNGKIVKKGEGIKCKKAQEGKKWHSSGGGKLGKISYSDRAREGVIASVVGSGSGSTNICPNQYPSPGGLYCIADKCS